jgi:hypothetical protein
MAPVRQFCNPEQARWVQSANYFAPEKPCISITHCFYYFFINGTGFALHQTGSKITALN